MLADLVWNALSNHNALQDLHFISGSKPRRPGQSGGRSRSVRSKLDPARAAKDWMATGRAGQSGRHPDLGFGQGPRGSRDGRDMASRQWQQRVHDRGGQDAVEDVLGPERGVVDKTPTAQGPVGVRHGLTHRRSVLQRGRRRHRQSSSCPLSP
jgi:hypothetical protein